MTERNAESSAMLIDSNGSIDGVHKRKKACEWGGDYYKVEIHVQTDFSFLIKLASLWGGTIANDYLSDDKKWLPRWTLTNRDLVRTCLNEIKPYVQVKRDAIDVALKLVAVLDAKRDGWKAKTRLLAEALRRLNNP